LSGLSIFVPLCSRESQHSRENLVVLGPVVRDGPTSATDGRRLAVSNTDRSVVQLGVGAEWKAVLVNAFHASLD
jgi:hypothetical protein